jgi:hypothetical protein
MKFLPYIISLSNNEAAEAEIKALRAEVGHFKALLHVVRGERNEALRAQLTAQTVVMPERSNERGSDGKLTYEAVAHNRCLDEVARLNKGAKP